jgi:hypothetical protein
VFEVVAVPARMEFDQGGEVPASFVSMVPVDANALGWWDPVEANQFITGDPMPLSVVLGSNVSSKDRVLLWGFWGIMSQGPISSQD